MKSRLPRQVMTSERRQMREMLAAGLTLNAIARKLRRSPTTVAVHLAPELLVRRAQVRHVPGRTEARRIERLYVACNQALAAQSFPAGHRP